MPHNDHRRFVPSNCARGDPEKRKRAVGQVWDFGRKFGRFSVPFGYFSGGSDAGQFSLAGYSLLVVVPAVTVASDI